jgi:hypothetical protein
MELVLIDAATPQIELFVQQLEDQAARGRPIAWLVVGAQENGVQAVSSLLAQTEGNVRAIHIVGHAQDGIGQLGSTRFDTALLRQAGAAIAAWGDHLSGDADILFYGCDMANGEARQQLLSTISTLTNADVAASNDATGAHWLGGNWELEFRTGSIEAASIATETLKAGFAHILAADFQTLSPDLPVNQQTSSAETLTTEFGGRQVAINASGITAVVWQDASGEDIFLRIFNLDGSPRSNDIFVNFGAHVFDARQPAVAINDAGDIVVVWTADGQDGSGDTVMARLYDQNGDNKGSPFRVNEATSLDQNSPAVAMAANGDFVVTWARYFDITSSTGVQMRMFNANGIAKGGEVEVNSFAFNDQENPSIAMDAGNNFVIAWQSKDQDGSGWGVYAQRYHASGVKAGSEFRVNTGQTSGDQFNPSVGMNASGQFVISWTNSASSPGIRAQAYQANGNPWGSNFTVDDNIVGDQRDSSALIFNDGSMLFAFQSQDSDGSKSVSGREFDAPGVASSSEASIPGFKDGDQEAVSIATAGGHLAMVWGGATLFDSSGVAIKLIAAPVFTGSVLVSTPGGTTVSEAGVTTPVEIVLSSAPASNVTITLSVSNSRLTLDRQTLTFTPTNWNTSQTVLMSLPNDTLVQGASSSNLVVSSTSADPLYASLDNQTFEIALQDDDLVNLVLVTTIDDSHDGDVSSLQNLMANKGADGLVSLREAILAANNTANGPGGVDQIRFDFGSLPANPTIVLQSALPAITQTVSIDGLHPNPGPARPGVLLSAPNIDLNGHAAIELAPGSDGSVIRGLAVGDVNADAFWVRSNSNVLEFNYVGLALDGSTPLSVTDNGFCLDDGGDGNVIRFNTIARAVNGIFLDGNHGTLIESNRIGVLAAGNVAAGTTGDGILLTNGTTGTVIRGNTIGAAGLSGIRLQDAGTNGNLIAGNYIGVTADGDYLGNADDGVSIEANASMNQVGGPNPQDGNQIKNNGKWGVAVFNRTGTTTVGEGPVDNAILGNRFADNTRGGILTQQTLGGPINTQAHSSDSGDADGGANRGQNSPLLSRAQNMGNGDLRITGSLNAKPNSFVRIEYFAAFGAAHPSGRGEGYTLLGSVNQAIDSSGTASLTQLFTGANLPDGTVITATATATDSTYSVYGDTSQFSANRLVVSHFPPAFTGSSNISVNENRSAIATLTATDPDTPQSALQWSIVGGASAYLFSINPSTGALSFLNPQDFENPQDANGDNAAGVRVRITDNQGNAAERNYNITIRDVNEAFALSLPSTAALVEDTPITFGDAVGSAFSLTDPDANAQIRVRLQATQLVLAPTATTGVTITAAPNQSAGQAFDFVGRVDLVAQALRAVGLSAPENYSGPAALRLIAVDTTAPTTFFSDQTLGIQVQPVDDAPVVQRSRLIALQAGSQKPITSALLLATDVDTASSSLVYTLESLPAGGVLLLNGAPLVVGSTFSQAAVDAGGLRYEHSTNESVTSSLQLRLTDGSNPAISVSMQVEVTGVSVPTTRPNASGRDANSTSNPSTQSATQNAPAPVAPVASDNAASGAQAQAASAEAGLKASGKAVAVAPAPAAEMSSSAPSGSPSSSREAGQVQQDSSRASFSLAADVQKAGPKLELTRLETHLGPSTARPELIASESPVRRALQSARFTEELAKVRENVEQKVAIERTVVASTAAVSASLSIGYVIWMLRGGVLLSTLLASLPAWRAIDPLPILQKGVNASDSEKSESLQSMLDKAREDRQAAAKLPSGTSL